MLRQSGWNKGQSINTICADCIPNGNHLLTKPKLIKGMKFNHLCNTPMGIAKVAPAMHNKAVYGATSNSHYSKRKTLLRMKLVILLTTIACVQAWSTGNSQTITLSLKNASLEKVFTEIRKQSPYSFIYTKEQLQGSKSVSLDVKQEGIENVLALCFTGQPVTYEISENQIIIKKKEKSINEAVRTMFIDIKGKVIGEKKEPLAGATITVKGTNRITITNESGEFSFTGVKENEVLIISSVGYTSIEYKLNGEKEITVQLKADVGELGDVMVKVNTGYQELQKERVTGSFTQINNKTFSEQVSTNILSRLEAIANSFSVYRKQNGPGQILIRGLSTINGPKNPLIVIDNFPYEGDINNINPNDVESITILKDAAAASIWGTRAGNGVIVITTKKGRFNQPVKVEFNSSLSITKEPDLFYLKNIVSTDFIDTEIFLYNKGFYNSQFNNFSRPPLSPVVEILRKRMLGQISALDSAIQIDAFRNIDVRNNFNKYLYQNSINQQYALNVRGGSNNIAWIASAGYDKNLSGLAAGYERLNLRLENTYKFSKSFQVTTSFYFTHSESTNGKPGYLEVSTINGRIPPYTQFADATGKPLPVIKEYRQPFIDTVGGGKLLDWNYYPLTDYKNVHSKNRVQDIIANIGFNYKIINGLSLDVKYQYEKQQGQNKVLYDVQSYLVRNLVNLFTNLNANDPYLINPVPKDAILDLGNTTLQSHKARAQLNYNKSWVNHDIVAIAGSEIAETHNMNNSNRLYGYKDNILTFGKIDYVNLYPTSINGAYSSIPDNVLLIDKLNRFVSFYANGAHTYKQKYTVSVSVRRDASNLFGLSTNDKWKPLWSAGVGWDISKESFYNIPFLPYLKLRTTYGYSGNVDQSKSAVTTINYRVASPYTQSPYARFGQYNNPDLRWEKVGQINIRLDFKTTNNIITGSIEYYQKKGTDLYGPSLVDYTGVSTPTLTKNIAAIKASGVDIELNSININTKSFNWISRLNMNFYKDKVTSYYLSSIQGGNVITGGSNIASIVGKPVYSIFSYKWAGLDPLTGDPQGYLNGQISKDYSKLTGALSSVSDLKYNGPAFPTMFGSLSNTFTWKSISASMLFMYEFGAYFQKSSINYNLLFTNRNGHSDYSLRWQKTGDEKNTNVPSLIYPSNSSRDNFYNGSEILIEKADNIRLKYITLSYDLNNNILKHLPLYYLQLYINVNDLGIIWRANKEKLDPDIGKTSVPAAKNFSVGVRIAF